MNGVELLKSLGFTVVEIPLTQGKWTKIDIDDAPVVLTRRWYAHRNKGGLYYACGETVKHTLHRQLCNRAPDMIDHRDGDGLNNRRHNLRECDNRSNQGNAKLRTDNTSGFRGVIFYAGRWQAHIRVLGKKIYLGRFDSPEEAARAYDQAARETFGEFAATNFPSPKH